MWAFNTNNFNWSNLYFFACIWSFFNMKCNLIAQWKTNCFSFKCLPICSFNGILFTGVFNKIMLMKNGYRLPCLRHLPSPIRIFLLLHLNPIEHKIDELFLSCTIPPRNTHDKSFKLSDKTSLSSLQIFYINIKNLIGGLWSLDILPVRLLMSSFFLEHYRFSYYFFCWFIIILLWFKRRWRNL